MGISYSSIVCVGFKVSLEDVTEETTKYSQLPTPEGVGLGIDEASISEDIYAHYSMEIPCSSYG